MRDLRVRYSYITRSQVEGMEKRYTIYIRKYLQCYFGWQNERETLHPHTRTCYIASNIIITIYAVLIFQCAFTYCLIDQLCIEGTL